MGLRSLWYSSRCFGRGLRRLFFRAAVEAGLHYEPRVLESGQGHGFPSARCLSIEVMPLLCVVVFFVFFFPSTTLHGTEGTTRRLDSGMIEFTWAAASGIAAFSTCTADATRVRCNVGTVSRVGMFSKSRTGTWAGPA